MTICLHTPSSPCHLMSPEAVGVDVLPVGKASIQRCLLLCGSPRTRRTGEAVLHCWLAEALGCHSDAGKKGVLADTL